MRSPEKDETYIKRCLYLARIGEGNVAPNPMVGAVLVHSDTIIGEGYHQVWGGPHAEVVCLQSVRPHNQHLIKEATLYVSLEPCAHFGKTPPCADLIIRHGIPNVVVGCTDSYREVAGRGIDKLKKAGIAVTVGVLERQCRRLNKRFFTFNEQRRPYITLKWAQTADGMIAHANFKRAFISNEYTARVVHRWRSQEMGIMVGTNTALFDDPELTTRYWPGRNPTRFVLDKTLRLPASLKLFDGQHPTVVFNSIKHHTHPNLMYYRLDPTTCPLPQVANALYELKIHSVLVEGGAQLLQSFIDAGMWDEAKVITSRNTVLGKGLRAPLLQQHQLLHVDSIHTDVIHTYAHQNNSMAG
jgi:diaminohydroxyphosphoribosylaminopyrimidine deaminase/5-amino-6-(5-phosphoribosylamino)uracil reductase